MDGDNGEVTIMEKRTMKKLNIGKGQRPGLRFNANGIETRKNILKAAAKLFAERGYDGTSFRDITEASVSDWARLSIISVSSIIFIWKR